MNSSDLPNTSLNQILEKSNDELREGKKIPLAEELEKKNSTKPNNQIEKSEISTLISNKEEKTGSKIVNSEKVVLLPSIIECSSKENSDDPIILKEIFIPMIQNDISFKEFQNKDTKSEIQNSFLNKKTKNFESSKDVNKNVNINKNIKDINSDYDESDNLEEEEKVNDPHMNYYFKYFYEEEKEDEYFEAQNRNKDLEDFDDFEKSNFDYIKNDKDILSLEEEKNIEKEKELYEDDYDEKFHYEQFNQDISCNKNNYNNGIIKDMENIEERSNFITYIQAPIEENISTYYKSKNLDYLT